jgi:hypothetical protein
VTASRGWANGRWTSSTAGSFQEQALRVDCEDPPANLLRGETFPFEHRTEVGCGAPAGLAEADDAKAFVPKPALLDSHGGHERCAGGRSGALDVVVKGQQALAVALEQGKRLVLGEVLPLDERIREAALDTEHKSLDESPVRLALEPRLAVAEVEGISEQGRVVGADVEADRQRASRVNPARGDVEADLADRDAHTVSAEVAEAEDALAIGDHHELDLRQGAVGEDLVDCADCVGVHIDAAGAAHDVRQLLAGLTDRRGVDDRKHLGEILRQQSIEQRLVAVEQAEEEEVALEVVGLASIAVERAADLLLDRRDAVREETDEAEGGALLEGEVGALVEQRVGQQLLAPEVDLES